MSSPGPPGYRTVEWTVENFGCWNEEVHGTAIGSPDFLINSCPCCGPISSFLLYPRGCCAGSVVHLRNPLPFSGDLSFVGPDGSVILAPQPLEVREHAKSDVQLAQGPAFEDIVARMIESDRLSVRLRFPKTGIARFRDDLYRMRTVIGVHDFSVRISAALFEKFDYGPLRPAHISTIEFPSDDDDKKASMDLLASIDTSGDENTLKLRLDSNGLLRDTFVCTRTALLDKNDAVVRSENANHLFRGGGEEERWMVSSSLKSDEIKEGFSVLLRIRAATGNTSKRECMFYTGWCKDHVDVTPTDRSRRHTLTVAPVDEEPGNSPVEVLAKDLMCLYQDQDFSDINLNCENVSFPVHRNILSARSPVFKTMLSTDMTEAASGSVDIGDLDPSTLGLFLTYLYTGEVEDLHCDRALKLYYAADKYQVPCLKKECSKFLCSNVSLSNVCDVLSLADRHQDDQLTSVAHDLILKNYNQVLSSVEWDSLVKSDPLLVAKTVTHFAQKKHVGNISSA